MDKAAQVSFLKYIYVLAGFLIVIIDWTRGSQVGSTWAWTVNLLGVVFALLLAAHEKFDTWKVPQIIIFVFTFVLGVGICYFWWISHQQIIYRDKLLTAVLNVWMVLFFVLNRIKNGKYKMSWTMLSLKRQFVLLFLFLALALISVNEDIWMFWIGSWMLLWYTTDIPNDCKREMIGFLTTGIIIAFLMLTLLGLLFRPFDNEIVRYSGFYANVNINALFYLIVIAALYWKRLNSKGFFNLLWTLVTVITYCLLVMTVSKTAWITLFILAIIYWIEVRLRRKGEKAIIALLKTAGVVVATWLLFSSVFAVVRYAPTILHHPIWYEGEYSINKVHSFDSADSEKYIDYDEFMVGLKERVEPYIRLFVPLKSNAAENGIAIGDKVYSYDDPDTWKYASALGRVSMWEYYLKNGRMWGHSNLDGHTFNPYAYTWHAQNVFVQVWYYYGIISACILLILLLDYGICLLKKMWAMSNAAYFVFSIYVIFMVFGLFEAVWYPGQAILTLMFILPKFIGLEKKSET